LNTIFWERIRPLLLWIGAALVLDLAGAQHVFMQQTVAAAALAIIAIVWLVPSLIVRADPSPHGALLPSLSLLPLIAFVASMIDLAVFIPKDGGWSVTRIGILLIGIVGLLGAPRLGAGAVAVVAALLGTAIRTVHMEYTAITPSNGDMLPLVNGAIANLLSGNSPYTTYQMPWEVPLTYLPVTWLSYLPPYLLGADLRWTNVAAQLIILAALAWLAVRRSGTAATWRGELTLVLWAWLYLQPSVIHWDTSNTAPITWALLAALMALVVAGRALPAAIALGLTAAGTPLIAVFGPFVGLHWLRRYGLQHTLRLLVIGSVVAAVIVAPFALWSPGDFVGGVYRWFNQIDGWPREKWLQTDPPVWSIITGFSGEFWARGVEGWLKPIQALIVGGAAALYWFRGARADRLSGHAAAAYLGFMLFNPVLWPYLYNPALVVGLVGLVALIAPQPVASRATEPVAEPQTRQPRFS
jgi:hypothetical protein